MQRSGEPKPSRIRKRKVCPLFVEVFGWHQTKRQRAKGKEEEEEGGEEKGREERVKIRERRGEKRRTRPSAPQTREWMDE